MKTKYIFIHCEKELKPDTVVFTVYIGSSKRDAAALQKVSNLTSSTDFYFKHYDNEVCNYLQKIHDSMSDRPWFVDDVPPRRTVTIAQLLRMLRNHLFSASPLPVACHSLCYLVDTHYRFNYNRCNGKTRQHL